VGVSSIVERKSRSKSMQRNERKGGSKKEQGAIPTISSSWKKDEGRKKNKNSKGHMRIGLGVVVVMKGGWSWVWIKKETIQRKPEELAGAGGVYLH